MNWITDRLPCSALPPRTYGERAIDWRNAEAVQLGDPWVPAPPPHDQPKTREEREQELLDAVDGIYGMGRSSPWKLKVLEAREALR